MNEFSTYGYATHVGPMGLAVVWTKGPIVECGSGPVSTHLLHWMCLPDRELLTLEDDEKWFNALQPYASPMHVVAHVVDWKRTLGKIDLERWGVAVVDVGQVGTPWSPLRLELLEFFASRAEIVVVHDTETDAFSNPTVWKSFAHVWTFQPKAPLPWTTLASSCIDFASMLGSPLR